MNKKCANCKEKEILCKVCKSVRFDSKYLSLNCAKCCEEGQCHFNVKIIGIRRAKKLEKNVRIVYMLSVSVATMTAKSIIQIVATVLVR